jgi:[ribosomal protein S18]-alanine N-acetyltransferase
VEIRRLGPGDEDVVRALATRPLPPRLEVLDDDRTIFLAAFEGDEPVGFVLSHDLPRRHDPPRKLLVYELDVRADRRRRGIGKALLEELARVARERGIRHAWVLADTDNEAALALYRSMGGQPRDVVELDFDYGGSGAASDAAP